MNEPNYNVPTKQEAIEIDRTGGHSIPLDRFLIAHFDSTGLSKAQRRILSQMAEWEGVRVKATLHPRFGFLQIMATGTRYAVGNDYAIFHIGKRGAVKGRLHYGWFASNELRITRGLPQVRDHVGELEEVRAVERRVAAFIASPLNNPLPLE